MPRPLLMLTEVQSHPAPIIGLGSQHDLSDPTVYDDDWLLHFSAQDLMPYYRNFSSLEDGLHMDTNCKDAGTGFPDREAYPCFYEKVAYGLATKGFDIVEAAGAATKTLLPVTIDVDRRSEPNVRAHEPAVLAKLENISIEGHALRQRAAAPAPRRLAVEPIAGEPLRMP